MSYKKMIFTGTLILTFSGFLSRILGFYNRIFLSKLIGAGELGIYQLIMPVYMLCFTLVCHGFETGISNLTSKYRGQGDKKSIHRLIRFACLLSLSLSFVLLLFLISGAGMLSRHLFHETSAASTLKIAALALPFVAIKSCLHGYYVGQNRSAVPAASQLVEQTARVGSIYLLSVTIYLYTADARIAAWGMVIGEMVSAIYTLLAYFYTVHRETKRKLPLPSPTPSSAVLPSMIREFFHFSIPLTINHFSLTIISSLENMLIPLMLLRRLGSRTLALETYGTLTGMALPFLFFPATIVNSLSVMLLPAISASYKQKKMAQIQSTISKSLHYCIVIGIFSCFAFFLFGKSLGSLVFSNEQAGEYVHLFALLCPFLYVSQTISSILNGFGCTRQTLFHNLLGMGIRILFILTAIPSLGIKGYLYGLLAGYSLQILLDISGVFRITFFPFFPEKTLLIPAAFAFSCGWASRQLCQILLNQSFSPLFALFFSGSCYVLSFFLLQWIVERFTV
ncbi:MAG: polysaccharide biosynthesis protein [Eubacteriales bacterium]|nr:polysaccharide biosynthesis protein [Eubacteriales bacterium]